MKPDLYKSCAILHFGGQFWNVSWEVHGNVNYSVFGLYVKYEDFFYSLHFLDIFSQ